MLKKLAKLFALIIFVFSTNNVQAQYGSQEISPEQVSITSQLIGRLDWAYDTYYEINLNINGQQVATATSIPQEAREKIEFLKSIITQAKEERKYLAVDQEQFYYNPLNSIKISDQSLPSTKPEPTEVRSSCDDRESSKNSWFKRFLNRIKENR